MTEPQGQHNVTSPEVQPIFFQWSIKKYSFFKTRAKISSGPFTIGDSMTPTTWMIDIFGQDGTRQYLMAYLTYLPLHKTAEDFPIKARFTLSIQSELEKVFSLDSELVEFSAGNLTHGGNVITFTDLEANEAALLPNDTLTVTCKGEIMCGFRSEPQEVPIIEIAAPVLSTDMKHLLKSGRGSDVKLMAEESAFPVHKAILIARSPVFAAMFEHDTLENETGEVVIKDVKPQVLENLIYFLYTDEAPQDLPEIATELAAAAQKYMLPRLQSMCENRLANSLTVDNVIDVIGACLFCNYSNKLKKTCLRFAKSHLKEVQESESWKAGAPGEVVKTLFEFCHV